VLNLVGADLRVSIPAAGALVTAYAPGLGIGEPIDRADGWNLVAGVSLHRPRSVPPYVPDITARFQQLSLPHADGDGEDVEGLEPIALGRVEQLARFRGDRGRISLGAGRGGSTASVTLRGTICHATARASALCRIVCTLWTVEALSPASSRSW
jgi:hypothetical protein